jgi:hypothetical protein
VNFKLIVPRVSSESLDQIFNFGWRAFRDLQEMTVVVHQKTSDVINVIEAARFVQQIKQRPRIKRVSGAASVDDTT